jgi:nicotinamidase-related amidase
MSTPSHIYEPLTSENAALVLVDHQVGLMSGVRDYSIAELKHNVVGLAKAAKALKLPIVVTTTARDSMWGPTIPELVEALPEVKIIDRSSVNAFDDPQVAHAIETTGRRKLVLRVFRSKFALHSRPSLLSAGVSMRTSLWTPAARSVRPNIRWACYG